MKKLVVASSAVLIATCVLVSCRSTHNNAENNNKTAPAGAAQTGNTKMARTRTASGLEYEVLKEGNGANPRPGNTVTVHYTGWLNNNDEPGKKFDSSYDRSQPFSFKIGIGQVIQGWDEGVMSMQIGEKRRLFIPSQLGYGSRGAGAVIPANANLIFDVELLQIS
jgi:FKBP-type peptidyl-prolyl cis-trans isomerase